jgi:hypothetical protein
MYRFRLIVDNFSNIHSFQKSLFCSEVRLPAQSEQDISLAGLFCASPKNRDVSGNVAGNVFSGKEEKPWKIR